MQPKKYSHKEINDAAMAARRAAEATYTPEALSLQHPIDLTERIETQLSSTTLRNYDSHNIARFIEELQLEQKQGATHFTLNWSTGDWADDEPANLEFIKMKTETVAEHGNRIARIREGHLQTAYARVQTEMLQHNDRVVKYLDLKAYFNA